MIKKLPRKTWEQDKTFTGCEDKLRNLSTSLAQFVFQSLIILVPKVLFGNENL